MSDQEEIIRHFFEDQNGERVAVEQVGEDNRAEYIAYLVDEDKIDLGQPVNTNVMRMPERTDFKGPEKQKAEKQAEEVLEGDDAYWIFKDETDRVIGHALNEEEDGATEMRIIIDDEEYRGLRSGEGESLYDFVTDIRIESAGGTPYVFNTHRKAQYKMENIEYEGRGFSILKWGSNFKGFEDEGVLMALQTEVGEAPEELYLPDMTDLSTRVNWPGVEEFVWRKLDEFYSNVDTDFRRSYDFDDFESRKDIGLSFQELDAPNGNRCYFIAGSPESLSGEGVKSGSVRGVLDTLEEQKMDTDYIIEARVDLEAPQSLDVVEGLVEDDWLVSGFVPQIGGSYDFNELSLIYPHDPVDTYLTEGVEGLFDQLGIPYRVEDGSGEIGRMKSIDARLGAMPRSFSEEEFPYSNFD